MTEQGHQSFGPYAEDRPAKCLLGAPIDALEKSHLFVAGRVRMRRLVGPERLYIGDHTDYWVQVDDQRQVRVLMASLVPPDQDLEDDCYRFEVRGDGDRAIRLSYGWAMLLLLAHEVLGLTPQDAQELLNGIYKEGFMPRRFGDLALSLQAGQRAELARERCLCLLIEQQPLEGDD